MDGEFLTADEASNKLWPSSRQALWFLLWWNLLVLPLHCPAGHEWKSFNSNSEKGNSYLHCTVRVPNPDYDSEDEDEEVPAKKLCNKKLTWRRPGTLPKYLANNYTPAQYLASLYWFASDAPYRTARKQAKVSSKNWAGFLARVRSILWLCVARLNPAQLGGEGKIVCIDETFLTKKKRCKGGFRGRPTAGTKKCVLGMLELDFETRRATGHCLLLEIPDRSARTLKLFIRRHVVAGSLIFTDSFKSYAWLSKPDSGFVHRCVNHKRREFSKTETIFGKEVVVSTNAAEGLFGRLKAFLRAKGAKKVSRDSYGGLLSEFLWTASCSPRQVDPFADLLEIKFWQDQHREKENHATSLKDSIPEEVLEDFLSVCEAPAPASPPGEAPVPEAPEAAPEDLSVESPSDVLSPSETAPEEPLAHVQQASDQASFPLPLSEACDSDSSDVELVLVRPAKRARATVKLENVLQNVLGVKTEPAAKQSQVVKQEPAKKLCPHDREPPRKFCPQGHDLMLKPLGTSTSSKRVGRREIPLVHWDRVSCDLCGSVKEQDHTWRCDTCDWDVCLECASLGLC